jgi:hypothetical protein
MPVPRAATPAAAAPHLAGLESLAMSIRAPGKPAMSHEGHRRGGAIRARWAAATLLSLAGIDSACAIDAIVIEARKVTISDAVLDDAVVRIDLARPPRDNAPPVRLDARRVTPAPDLPALTGFTFDCPAARLDEPRFACDAGRVSITSSPLGALGFPASVELRIDTGVLRARATAVPLAGGRARLEAMQGPRDWSAALALEGATAAGLLPLLGPAVALPKGFELEGRIDGSVEGGGRDDAVDALRASGTFRDVSFTNEAGTIVGEKLAATVDVEAQRRRRDLELEARLRSSQGQALAGPVLLNLAANPLDSTARGTWRDGQVAIEALRVAQKDLLRATGDAQLSFVGGGAIVRRARIDIEQLQMPAAYTSFAQIALAATDFGALTTAGTLRGEALLADDAVAAVQLQFDGLDLADPRHEFAMRELRGTLNWAPAGAAAPAPSFLAWREAGIYGLSGGASRLDFRAQGAGFRLLEPARMPVFDGAIAIRTLALADADTDNLKLEFEGDIEPIGMPRLARAFGWPEFAGTISGRVPRVELKDKLLTFGGDLEARVFDGRIVGRNIRLQDPLGKWPRFFADVLIEDLDLGLVTSTFSVGSITGRLQGSVKGLELFAWAPVAFDAVLETPAGYRGPRRISARAVGQLSNIGGGGGGVRAALESGLFSLFDEYDYERLGLRCRLVNDVCTMAGVEATPSGYYILKGRGVPRIDIIGNAGRVNWPQLASQIGAQMRGEGKIEVR